MRLVLPRLSGQTLFRCLHKLSQRWHSTTPKSRHQRNKLLPDAPARTRFAPSPTGYLHIGSLRTALFNYLLAKKTSGQFLLRVEDTDSKRTVADAERRLYEDLRWAGLEWDEGPEVGGPYGPYRQSERTQIYQEHAHTLLKTPHAYRCFCSVERLDELARRREALGLPTDYDRTCESLSQAESDERASRGESHVVRLRAPNAYPEFVDLIYGQVGKSNQGANAGVTMKHGEIAYEDPVLLKSDGHPTYHFANVIDDHLMKITHVVRATEWISSTPKHLALYDAFGWEPPQYAHVGLLVDSEGRKLSKRNFDTDVRSYRNAGVSSEAMVNFAALLGWSHGRKSDVMELAELVKEFQMKFTKGNTTVTLDKLWFLQRQHSERIAKSESPSLDVITTALADFASSRADVASDEENAMSARISEFGLKQYWTKIFRADARNYESFAQFYDRSKYFLQDPMWSPGRDETEAARLLSQGGSHSLRAFEAVSTFLDGRHLLSPSNEGWNASLLDAVVKAIAIEAAAENPGQGQRLIDAAKSSETVPASYKMSAEEKEVYKYVCKWLRHILFASSPGPNLGSAMEIIGRDACRRRLVNYQNTSL